MAEILGVPDSEWMDADEEVTPDAEWRFLRLHVETAITLQIGSRSASSAPGGTCARTSGATV